MLGASTRGGGKIGHIFKEIISLENLFIAWQEFKRGKERKHDVQVFAMNVEDHLFELHTDLKSVSYKHGDYTAFVVCDPKRRDIHKASVRDRVLHHAIHRVIEPIFDKAFIFDSYSSRKNKGTHAANRRFRAFAWKLSRNNTKTVWVLKADIRKFFDSVNHRILIGLLEKRLEDPRLLILLEEIIRSFRGGEGSGIPLGNLTSQLFSNVMLDPFDQYVKRSLRIKNYIRYADDFTILSSDAYQLETLIPFLESFLKQELGLELHPMKLSIQAWHQGIDFLGYVSFPIHSVLRTKTKKRVLKRFDNGELNEASIQSYLGILSHCRAKRLAIQLKSTLNAYS